MVEVANMTRTSLREGDVRCDRETKWGNPFIMYYQDKRDIVCDLYDDYIDEILKPNNQTMVRMVLRAGGLTPYQVDRWIQKTGGFLDISELTESKRLLCHCAPLRCHCDTLKRKIEAIVVPEITVDGRK